MGGDDCVCVLDVVIPSGYELQVECVDGKTAQIARKGDHLYQLNVPLDTGFSLKPVQAVLLPPASDEWFLVLAGDHYECREYDEKQRLDDKGALNEKLWWEKYGFPIGIQFLETQRGLVVTAVAHGSIACQAGVNRGDCFVSLNGEAIQTTKGFLQLLRKYIEQNYSRHVLELSREGYEKFMVVLPSS